jgi:hypothetical protein
VGRRLDGQEMSDMHVRPVLRSIHPSTAHSSDALSSLQILLQHRQSQTSLPSLRSSRLCSPSDTSSPHSFDAQTKEGELYVARCWRLQVGSVRGG